MLVWKRQEIQKMPRCQRIASSFLVFATLPVLAAILPEGIELHARKAVTKLTPEPAAVWAEYGLQEAEKAEYSGAKGQFTVSAWRLPDATSALAAWQMLRPAGSRPVAEPEVAVKAGNTLLITTGNYVLQFDGFTPESETLTQLTLHMPRFDRSSLPAFIGFVPAAGRIANSERFILGPATLAAFAPALSPSAVGFHFGTEGQLARFKDKDGEVVAVLFNYPNQQIARDRVAVLQEVKGTTAKRSGPLVAVVLSAPNEDTAQRFLAGVRWEANVTLSEKIPDPQENNIGVLILNIAKFSGMMVIFCVVAGVGFAGFRALGKKMSGETASGDGSVIGLHLEERSGK